MLLVLQVILLVLHWVILAFVGNVSSVSKVGIVNNVSIVGNANILMMLMLVL